MSRSSHLLVQGPRQELEPGKTRSKSRSRAEEDGQEKCRSILSLFCLFFANISPHAIFHGEELSK